MKQSRLKMEASFLKMIFSPLTDKKKVTEIDIYMTVHVHARILKTQKIQGGGPRNNFVFLWEYVVRCLFTGIWNSYIYSTIQYLVSQTYLYLVLPFNKWQCCIRTYFILFLFDPYEFSLVDPRPPLTTAAVEEHTQCDPHRAHHHDRHRDRPVQK